MIDHERRKMRNEFLTSLIIIGIFIILVITLTVIVTCGLNTEGIHTEVLDVICQELTGNETSTFVPKIGHQLEFPCKTGNVIDIFAIGE